MVVRTLKVLFPAAIVIAVSLVMACGDDDDATPTPEVTATPEATATLQPGDATPTPTHPPATTEAGMELVEFTIRPNVTRARPGTVIFKVQNAGELAHQFVVIRSDLPTAELPRKPLDAGVDETKIEIVGKIDSIAPGSNAEVSVPVDAGKYVLICNLFAGGESHYLEGMYTAFEVTPTAPDPLSSTKAPSGVSPAPSPTP
jgi:uncharacterized cupredoxin-like copper-binding protein